MEDMTMANEAEYDCTERMHHSLRRLAWDYKNLADLAQRNMRPPTGLSEIQTFSDMQSAVIGVLQNTLTIQRCLAYFTLVPKGGQDGE
jgi:hypothetical protein